MMWPTRDGRTPLWAYAEVNPATPEFSKLPDGTEVTFMPLEAVWPDGRADQTRRANWSRKGSSSYTQFQRGDVLLPKVTPTFQARRTMVADQSTDVGLATSEVHVVRPLAGTDAGWLSYVLRSDEFVYEGTDSLQGVGGLRRIGTQQVGDYAIPTTPPEKQRRLAEFLGRELAEIDAMDADLNHLTQILQERKIAAISAPWSSSESDSWEIRPLWSMFRRDKVLGFTNEPMVSVFREHGVVFKDDHSNLNVTAQDRSIYQLIEPGWLVINRMKAWQGSVGVSAIRGITSGHYICFRPLHDEDSSYFNWMFRSPRFKDWFAAYSRGVRPGQAEIDNSYLDGMPVLIPPRARQRRIAAELHEQTSRIDDMITDAHRLKALLAERRSTLITDVVTGKKEVTA